LQLQNPSPSDGRGKSLRICVTTSSGPISDVPGLSTLRGVATGVDWWPVDALGVLERSLCVSAGVCAAAELVPLLELSLVSKLEVVCVVDSAVVLTDCRVDSGSSVTS